MFDDAGIHERSLAGPACGYRFKGAVCLRWGTAAARGAIACDPGPVSCPQVRVLLCAVAVTPRLRHMAGRLRQLTFFLGTKPERCGAALSVKRLADPAPAEKVWVQEMVV